MRTVLVRAFALGLLASCQQGLAQLVPNLGPVVQTVTDRQAERIQQQAVERVQQQAEAAQARVAEQAQLQQVETIQNRIVDRVESQVERAQAQTTERAQNQIERVQNQVERTQSQLERVQNQALERSQGRVDLGQGRAGEVLERRLEAVPGSARQPGAAAEEAARGLAAATEETAGALPVPPQRQLVPDPDGNLVFVEITIQPGIRAIEFEWIMLVTPAERQQLNNEAAALLDFLAGTQPFALTEGEMLTFRVPPDLDANDAILQLLPENLRGLIDRNHLYSPQDAEADEPAGSAAIAALALPMTPVCEQPVVVGLIDSAIDTDHVAFGRHTRIRSKSFVEAPLVPSLAHGTAVASLLVGEQTAAADIVDMQLRPLLPRATLYSAAVFHSNEQAGQGATLMRVLAALDWLVGQDDVEVINMSLAGPSNRLLAQAVAAATAKGKVVVAAAGNEGAHGPLRYPAAYDDVVGVTAVDRNIDIYRWANQGPHIDYAALGVAVPVAKAGGGFAVESGTSMAAPVVAAFVACALADSMDLEGALASLQARLVDLGEPGIDPVYGKGLLHP
jgi:minor extracellular protease Epr